VMKVTPKLEGKALVVKGNLLVQTRDVGRCLEAEGRLIGTKYPLGRDPKIKGATPTIPGAELLPLGVVDAGVIYGFRSSDSIENALKQVGSVEAIGVASVIADNKGAKHAERALWATMTSSADGFVDRVFNRPLGRFLSKVLIHTPVSPNMVSIASIIIGVIAAIFLAEGSYRFALIGAILFQLSAIVDCVDGEIARILFKESPLGKWIDLVGDQIVHISIFAGIAFGVLRNGGGKETVWLGLSAMIGALISFAVILRGMRQPAGAGGSLQKLIDAATNRDFSVIVLALALVQKLPWFLWMAGIGSHLFWIAALGLQIAHQPQKLAGQPR
jgi:phosphatidylglycerophosphate synthase